MGYILFNFFLLCRVLGDNFLRDHVVGSSRGCPLLQLNFRKSDLLILYNGGPDLIPILPEPETAFPGGSTCSVCTSGAPSIVNLSCGHAAACSEY